MHKIYKVFINVGLLLGLLLTQSLFAQATPIPMLEETAANILNALEKNKGQLKENHQIIYATVKQYLLPHVDVAGMSRSALGRDAWLKASASEQAEFSKAFTALIIRTYASPLAEYKDEKITFLPLRGATNARFIRVNSLIIRSNAKNIPLTYSLVAKNGEWKIYDLSVEGVSLLQSFRSQFAQSLQHSNMAALIKQMQTRQ